MSAETQIKYGALISYISIFINIITGLIYTPWMIRCIGKSDYGLFTLAMSVISIFVFDFGLSSAVTRYISKYLAEGRLEKVGNFMALIYKLYIYIDVIICVVLSAVYFIIPTLYKQLTPLEIEKFKIIYVISAIYSICAFPFIPLNGILVAYEKFIQNKICELIHKLFIVVTMTICLLAGYGLYALVMVNALSGLLTIIIKAWCVKIYTNQTTNWQYSSKKDMKEVASYSSWVTIKSISQRCIMNLAPSILGIISGSIEIAILGIAITIEGYVYTFSSAVSGMFLPKVSRDIANNKNILPLMEKIGRIQIYIVGLIITGFILFGSKFIGFWVGESFNDSYLCAVLMIIPAFFHLPQEIAHQTIYATNKVKLEAYVFVLMALINVILAFVLSPLFGAKGVGLSICISYFFRTAGMDYIYYKYLKIDIPSFFRNTYLKMSVTFFALLLVGGVLNILFREGIIALICSITIYTFVYGGLFYKFVFNDFEKQLALGLFKRQK